MNLIERLTILACGSVVNVADLPEMLRPMTLGDIDYASVAVEASSRAAVPGRMSGVGTSEAGIDRNEAVSALERDRIMNALEKASGVRSKAAQLLGPNRTTLLEKQNEDRDAVAMTKHPRYVLVFLPYHRCSGDLIAPININSSDKIQSCLLLFKHTFIRTILRIAI